MKFASPLFLLLALVSACAPNTADKLGCQNQSDCLNGFVCSEGLCNPEGAAALSEQGPSDPEPVKNTTKEDESSGHSGSLALGAACAEPDECQSGRCEDQQCVSADFCRTTPDCETGRCVQGQCKAWTVETVTTEQPARLSLALSKDGTPHIAYTDLTVASYYKLLFASRENGSWAFSEVSNEGGEDVSMRLDSVGHVHMTHTDRGFGVRYTTRVDGAWKTTVVDANGTQPSLALDFDTPAIAYVSSKFDISIARLVPIDSKWIISPVVSSPNIVASPTLAFKGGQQQLAYFQNEGTQVHWALQLGRRPSTWNFENKGAFVGWPGHVSLALHGSEFHLAYSSDLLQGEDPMKYLGSGTPTTFSAVGDFKAGTAIALDDAGRPFYCFAQAGVPVCAFWNGTAWETERVSSPCTEVKAISVAHVGKTSAVAYTCDDGLRLATFQH